MGGKEVGLGFARVRMWVTGVVASRFRFSGLRANPDLAPERGRQGELCPGS